LAEIARRSDQVARMSVPPTWFGWPLAALTVVLAIGIDTRRPLIIGIGTSVFVVGMLALLAVVIGPSQIRAPLRRDLPGPRTAAVIIAWVGLSLLANLPTAFILKAAGAPYPATIGALAGGVVLGIGGHLVARSLTRIVEAGTAR
jgi:hypothetical protein